MLYGENLRPPAGYVFDAAVATTFSLDFETALAVPVSLALFAAENRDEILAHPWRCSKAPSGSPAVSPSHLTPAISRRRLARIPACARLLERIIVEVAAPTTAPSIPRCGRCASGRAPRPARLRLLVLSRNLTRDRSWDIALTARRR